MLQIRQYFMQMNDDDKDEDEEDEDEEICVVCGGNCSGCGKCGNN